MDNEYLEEEEYETERLYKILVVGEIATGKTSIIKQYVHNLFGISYKATIGVDFALKILEWSSDTLIQLWDIAGQERYGNMTRVYYKDAVGAFVVFDATRPETLDAVVKWKRDIDNKVFQPNGDPIPVVLLANKADLEDEMLDQVKDREFMNAFCKKHGFLKWFLTSAKNNSNIAEASRSLVEEILRLDTRSGEGDGNDSDIDAPRDLILVDENQDTKVSTATTTSKQNNGGCCGA